MKQLQKETFCELAGVEGLFSKLEHTKLLNRNGVDLGVPVYYHLRLKCLINSLH